MKRDKKLRIRRQTAEARADRLLVQLTRQLRGCRNVSRLFVFVPGRERPMVHTFDPPPPAKSA